MYSTVITETVLSEFTRIIRKIFFVNSLKDLNCSQWRKNIPRSPALVNGLFKAKQQFQWGAPIALWRQHLFDWSAILFINFFCECKLFGSSGFIECFHMTSRRPYWCPKTMKRRPCWCPKPVLWELNSFLMQTLSFVSINLHRCWPREWKHSIIFCRYLTLARVHVCYKITFIRSLLSLQR